MHVRRTPYGLVAALVAASLGAQTADGQEPSSSDEGPIPAHVHIRHVADEFRGTPENRGILPTALAEADIAHRHATLAAQDPADLDNIKRHTVHVMHALDPSAVEGGPGLGYGAMIAAERAAHYIELSAASAGATDGIKTHSNHVATAARSAAANAQAAMEVARQIQEAENASEAAELLGELTALTDAIRNGVDADGDGSVGWQEGEGGLAQAETHLGLLKRGEGLTG